MANTNEIIGYRVVNSYHGFFVGHNPEMGNFPTDNEPQPIPRGDAFRRLAAYLDANPNEDHATFDVEPVYRETSPMENATAELTDLLVSLADRHGLKLGLDSDQIAQKIAKELSDLGITDPAGVSAFVGR